MRIRHLLSAAALLLFGAASAHAQDLAFEDDGARYVFVQAGWGAMFNPPASTPESDGDSDPDLVEVADILALAAIAPSYSADDLNGTTFDADGTLAVEGVLNLPDQAAANLSVVHAYFMDTNVAGSGAGEFALYGNSQFERSMKVVSPNSAYEYEDPVIIAVGFYLLSGHEGDAIDSPSHAENSLGGEFSYSSYNGDLDVSIDGDSVYVSSNMDGDPDEYEVEFDPTFDSIEVDLVHESAVGFGLSMSGTFYQTVQAGLYGDDAYGASGMVQYGFTIEVAPVP